MYAKVQKWGNSHGPRIPKVLLDSLNITENDQIEIIRSKDALIIRKIMPIHHRNIEERLTAFYGKQLNEIVSMDDDKETDWGDPKGSEIW